MTDLALVFPHQLFANSPLLSRCQHFVLVEEPLFFRQYKFHQQKLLFARASMRFYRDFLSQRQKTVRYIDQNAPESDVRILITDLQRAGIREIHCIDPIDDWLERRTQKTCEVAGIALHFHASPMFINSQKDIDSWFTGRKIYRQNEFYIQQRRRLNLLLEPDGKPTGGKWSFDADNRLRYPRGKTPPAIQWPEQTTYHREATDWVKTHFPDNPGSIDGPWRYPISHAQADAWLDQFLEWRLAEFGPYEDALVAEADILQHSILTPMLNSGLLTPSQVLEKALTHADSRDIPLNSLEGFVRQITGWREFIRGMYQHHGRYQRSRNFWQFKRQIPASFYTGTTGILPIDITIRKLLESGYNHHIERLMVLGNFMLLCEFDPAAVYRWFMEMYIDAYDWVMVPNVYGMSQFADGGLMATKPYISGSNYLRKMGDYPRGEWEQVWDGLFWRFLYAHRGFFSQNPRLNMLLKTFDKMSEEKKRTHLESAECYLEKLDKKTGST
jgi:deoxyribodipyrimidine photolyase-related protein